MYPYIFVFLARQERNMELLKEAEQQRLIQVVRENRVHSRGWQQLFSDWSGQTVGWLGARLTLWGAKLQNRQVPVTVISPRECQNCR